MRGLFFFLTLPADLLFRDFSIFIKSKMRNLTLILFCFFSAAQLFSQELAQIKFESGSNFSGFSLITDGNLLIRFSTTGNIIDWGTEEQSFRNPSYFSPKLLPYSGRVDYYGKEADSAFIGKIKSIGSCQFSYFGTFEDKSKRGRLKSAGRLIFDYYSDFDLKELQGKIKMMGSQLLTYFPSYSDMAYGGKLKSVGNTSVSYYSSFDDKAIKGKIKSIGGIQYAWYTSYDVNYGPGSLKNAQYRQLIAGITYIVQ